MPFYSSFRPVLKGLIDLQNLATAKHICNGARTLLFIFSRIEISGEEIFIVTARVIDKRFKLLFCPNTVIPLFAVALVTQPDGLYQVNGQFSD